MARQRRGSAAPPRRPTAPASRPTQQQTRPSSTAAAPPARTNAAAPPAPAQSQAPQAPSQGPGLFGQMASTAAGVAIGSSVGHAIGGFFGGGSSAPPAETQQAAAPPAAAGGMDSSLYQSNANSASYGGPPACEVDVRNFRQCMDDNQGNMTVCGWYLDQLKACQQASSQY